MIGLDTNVLVRYFVRDDSSQAKRAMEIITSELSPASPGYITAIVLAELAWVLDRFYKLTRDEIAEIIYTLLSTNVFSLQHRQQVYVAYLALLKGFDFADALIGALNSAAGCTTTLTFDRKASRLPGFELI